MSSINKFLLMLIAMVTIMLVAVGIDKGYEYYQDLKWERERAAVYERAKAEVEAMQATIETLSQNPDELLAYIEGNELNYIEVKTVEQGNNVEEVVIEETFSGQETVTDNRSREQEDIDRADNSKSSSMSAGSVSANSISSNQVIGETVSDNDSVINVVSGNSVSVNMVSGNTVNNTVSTNTVSANTVSSNTVSSNTISANNIRIRTICASYEETIKINAADKKVIAGSTIDFSDIKIACLGDSITAGTNLVHNEGYETMTYPYFLSQILGAEEVVNLGIGGSSIGRYWDQAFVDRYEAIPKDTDLIIVMGGTNDGFCATKRELGSLEKREQRTFTGDLDELLRGLKEDYPNAKIILASPLSNVLHDMLRKTNEELLPQSAFADIMKELAKEYNINYIDLYNANFLDTHDAAIIHNFMPDGVHGNAAGYKILAEHMAAEIIHIYAEAQE